MIVTVSAEQMIINKLENLKQENKSLHEQISAIEVAIQHNCKMMSELEDIARAMENEGTCRGTTVTLQDDTTPDSFF